MTITALPEAPARSDAPSLFITKADAFVAALAVLVTEINATAAGFDVSLWVSGTEYEIGNLVWSPVDFFAYRRKTDGAGVTDPSADAANWALLDLRGIITAKGSLLAGTAAGALAELVAGSDGLFLETKASEAAGVRWGVPSKVCEGRLTLTTGVPVATADVSAAGTSYFSPYKGDKVTLYDGTKWRTYTFAELSQAAADATKSPAAVVAEAGYDKFVWDDAGTLRCTRGPAWSKAAAVTMTIAAPCVVTWAAHGLRHGAPIVFTTTDTLPTGVVAGTVYYISKIDANTFNLCASFANVVAGTLITSSGAQAGAHTGTNRDTERGAGAGTTELETFEGRLVNKYDITNGPLARRGLYVGSLCSDANAQYNDSGGGGTSVLRNVCNYYNSVVRQMRRIDTTDSWTFSTNAYRIANGSASNRLEWFCGWPVNAARGAVSASFSSDGATNGMGVAVGYDSLTEMSGVNDRCSAPAANAIMPGHGEFVVLPDVGRHYMAWLEGFVTGGTTTWLGDSGATARQSGIQGEVRA